MLNVLDHTVDLFYNGHPHAERRLRELREAARHGADQAVGRAIGALEVLLAIRAGRLDEAELMADEPMQIVAIRWYQGRLPEVPGIDCYAEGAALAAAQSADRELAVEAIGRLDLAQLSLVALYGVIEAAFVAGDRTTALRAYTMMKPHARMPMVADRGVACFGSVEHALGVASLTVGALD